MKNYHPYHRDHTVSKLIVLLLLIIIIMMAALKGTDTIIATIRALLDACMPAVITIVGLCILVKTLFRK